ncbi:MAG: pilus assembly protein [Magnetospirillum sp.]|nr:pilus assembly protein [Magnetospirillum sp.]
MSEGRNLSRCDRGNVAVEFALLLPVFLLFILGTVEFGRAMWDRSMLQFACEEATRYALAHSTASNSVVIAQAQAELIGIPPANVAFTVASTASQVSVSATYTFDFLVPSLLPFGPITLSALSEFPR